MFVSDSDKWELFSILFEFNTYVNYVNRIYVNEAFSVPYRRAELNASCGFHPSVPYQLASSRIAMSGTEKMSEKPSKKDVIIFIVSFLTINNGKQDVAREKKPTRSI